MKKSAAWQKADVEWEKKCEQRGDVNAMDIVKERMKTLEDR